MNKIYRSVQKYEEIDMLDDRLREFKPWDYCWQVSRMSFNTVDSSSEFVGHIYKVIK